MSSPNSSLSFPVSPLMYHVVVPDNSPTSPHFGAGPPSGSSHDGDSPSTPILDSQPLGSLMLASSGVNAILPPLSLPRRPNPPRRLLHTPDGAYLDTSYSATRPGSSSHLILTTSVSDHLPKPNPEPLGPGRFPGDSIGPERSSDDSSRKSWGSGINNSVSSAGVSPPLPRQTDLPEYEPRLQRSSNSTTVPKLIKSRILSLLEHPGTTRDDRKEHRRRHKRHKATEKQPRPNKCLPHFGRQLRDLSRVEACCNRVQRSCITSASHSGPVAAPSIPSHGRRWSSIDIEGILRSRLGDMSELLTSSRFKMGTSPPKGRTQPASNTEPKLNEFPGSNVVSTIREIMTVRRVEADKVDQTSPPKSISLERASSVLEKLGMPSSISGATSFQPLAHQNDEDSCNPYCPRNPHQRRASHTSIISNQDVEANRHFVDAKIQEWTQQKPPRNYVPMITRKPLPLNSPPASGIIHPTEDGLPPADMPPTPYKAHSSSCARCRKSSGKDRYQGESSQAREAEGRSGRSSITSRHVHDIIFKTAEEFAYRDSSSIEDDISVDFGCLNKSLPPQVRRPLLQLSMYEPTWKQGHSPLGSPVNSSKLPRFTYFASEPIGPQVISGIFTTLQKASSSGHLLSSYFPNSIHWPLAHPSAPAVPGKALSKAKSTVSLTTSTNCGVKTTRESSRPGSSRKAMTTKAHRRPRLTLSEPQLLGLVDVVSFPPLPPRKSTIDWHSPLPDVEAALERNPTSLYHMGLDMRNGPSQKSLKMATPLPNPYAPALSRASKETRQQLIRSGTMSNLDIKDTIKLQPKAPPLIAVSPEATHSLERCSGDRRRSSTRVMKRVTTIDDERKALKTGIWAQARPPSVCPPPQTLSPFELRIEIPSASESMHRLNICSPCTMDRAKDRLTAIQQKIPQSTRIDCAGIYGKFNGTGVGISGGFGVCPEHCPPAECTYCEIDPRSPSVDWIA